MKLKASPWLTKRLTSPLLWPSCWMWCYSNELAEVQSLFLFISCCNLAKLDRTVCPIWFKNGTPNIYLASDSPQQLNTTATQNTLSFLWCNIPACCASNKTGSPSFSRLTRGSHKRLQMREFLSVFREQGVFPLKGGWIWWSNPFLSPRRAPLSVTECISVSSACHVSPSTANQFW